MARKADIVNKIIDDLKLSSQRIENLISLFESDWEDLRVWQLEFLKGSSNEIEKDTYNMEFDAEDFLTYNEDEAPERVSKKKKVKKIRRKK